MKYYDIEKYTLSIKMQGLQQWTAAYLQASEQGEPFLFGKMRETIKQLQDAGKLKEIIFMQLAMIIQTLKVMNAVPEETFRARTKKILALLYNDNLYLTQLVEQLLEIISHTQQHIQNRGMQNVQPHVKRGPPAGQSIC